MPFEFRETMAGSYRLLDRLHDERPLSFSLRARSHSFADFVRSPVVDIVGEMDAEGFADHRPLRGTLGLDLLRTGKLPYAFSFTGNDGAPYRFVGEKTVRFLDFAKSMSVLPGELVAASGDAVASALVRFDLRHDLLKFLASYRLA